MAANFDPEDQLAKFEINGLFWPPKLVPRTSFDRQFWSESHFLCVIKLEAQVNINANSILRPTITPIFRILDGCVEKRNLGSTMGSDNQGFTD